MIDESILDRGDKPAWLVLIAFTLSTGFRREHVIFITLCVPTAIAATLIFELNFLSVNFGGCDRENVSLKYTYVYESCPLICGAVV